MVRVFISTFGFTESVVLAPIVRLGLGKEDRLVVLIPSSLGDDRVSNALKRLRDMLDAISGRSFDFETVEVPIEDFVKAVNFIIKLLLREAEKGRVYVNISGGMRALVIEAYTATLLTRMINPNVLFTDLELEGSAGSLKIVPVTFPKNFNKTKQRILSELKRYEVPVRMSVLSKSMNLSLSTLSRNLRELANNGLVKLKKKGRILFAEITNGGKIFAS